ncbi:hypothetical protein D3227_04920 [Mesorhizobium waimense]|uniref:HEAT repeat domain-containing protein n=1 Tax=Mesorhizobium waimense TaxID=1300307 RepID=A0A3A5LCE3_9HYPH|nr:hypothetical protein [Mesorhizobium waimense]RJT42022.1 hypothetical protein D3227_04920 [Mesorhizobium waimense]
MLNLADRTRNFWCAAYFYRRADPSRDRAIVPKVLEQVTTKANGTVKDRAATLLREINEPDRNPPRA